MIQNVGDPFQNQPGKDGRAGVPRGGRGVESETELLILFQEWQGSGRGFPSKTPTARLSTWHRQERIRYRLFYSIGGSAKTPKEGYRPAGAVPAGTQRVFRHS